MEKMLQKPVAEFMTKKVIAVQKNELIKELFQLMDKHGILGVPVVDEDSTVIGMVTEGDLIEHFTTLQTPSVVNLLGSLIYLGDLNRFNEQLKEHCAETVEELMNPDVITLESSATLQDAINRMAEANVNRLPVTDEKGKLLGIVTRSDIVHQIAKLKTV